MSSAEERKRAKINGFLSDLLRFGCLRGFKYFSMHMRGREELVVHIMNAPQSISPVHSPSTSFSSSMAHELPRNQNSLMISATTQRRLSGYGYINVGLPPASPCEREIVMPEEHSTVFLVALYDRYHCPYVWVRSNHDRLVRLSGEEQTEKDNPLKLRSTTAWASQDIRVWDVIAELVDICTIPAPINPFALEHGYFETLPLLESLSATGAMLYFLQRILDGRMHRYDSQVRQDVDLLCARHFRDVEELHAIVRMGAEPARPMLSVTAIDDDAYVVPE